MRPGHGAESAAPRNCFHQPTSRRLAEAEPKKLQSHATRAVEVGLFCATWDVFCSKMVVVETVLKNAIAAIRSFEGFFLGM